MKKRFLLIGILVLILTLALARPALAQADLSKLNKLENISLYEDANEARIVFRFSKTWDKKLTPKFFEKSAQLEIDGAFITPAKRSFSFSSPFAKSAALYQMSPNRVRARLFFDGDARRLKKGHTVSINGAQLIVTFKKTAPAKTSDATKPPTVPAAITKEPTKNVSRDEKISEAERRIIQAALSATDPKPATQKNEKLPTANKTKPRAANKEFSFFRKAEAREKSGLGVKSAPVPIYEEPVAPEPPSMVEAAIKMASALLLSMGILFFFAWLAKKYKGTFGSSFGSGGLITVLSSGSIGVKKQVVLIDVAGEVLALGVSEENISMLASFDDQETIDRIRRGSVTSSSKGDEMIGQMLGKLASDKKESFLARLFARKNKVAPLPSALMDETDPETFAGALSQRVEEPVVPNPPVMRTGVEVRDEVSFSTPRPRNIEVRDDKPMGSRKEMMRKVTDTIRKQQVIMGQGA